MVKPWVLFLLGGWLALQAFSAPPATAQGLPEIAGEGGPIARRAEGFDAPNVARSKFLGWVRRNLTDRIPGDETLFKQYVDEWGFQFETLSINGIVFAINIDVDGKYPFDITLMDTDCDGVFETKVEEKPGQRADLSIPECVFRPATAEKR
ncbi:MAG: hypothetical protein HY618_03760 [Candidatus Tectomicrobia bacterium]|uniref:Uncharacterized protein n=1 Tax=Tectimicrobiota bacterium TaxID=2528274 RepID=A0A932ZU79_UNCTE|nr:hypothetical protein [Candidatus Tectomicrobia bacterium]